MTGADRNLMDREPTKLEATILFADIRGFSALFDDRDPLEALNFANAVLSRLGRVIEAAGGAIDKFTGDGFLAHFGVIDPMPDHVRAACRAALAVRAELQHVNDERFIDDQPVVAIGMGLHSGTVACGVISTPSKSEFTVLGRVVNMAARIEGLTKEFAVDCLVSQGIAASVKDEFLLKAMPRRTLRGIAGDDLTYWLLPTNIV